MCEINKQPFIGEILANYCHDLLGGGNSHRSENVVKITCQYCAAGDETSSVAAVSAGTCALFSVCCDSNGPSYTNGPVLLRGVVSFIVWIEYVLSVSSFKSPNHT